MIVPVDSPVNADMPTPQQKAVGEEKYYRAATKRMEKIKELKNKEIDIFINSNQSTRNLKEKMMDTLSAKDHYDCKAENLEEHFSYAC